jgi:hypothetical protein
LDEQEFNMNLEGVLSAIAYGDDNEPGGFYPDDGIAISRVSTFEQCGVMTMNKGLVVAMEDGSEFQITVVQSKQGKNVESDDEGDDGG